MKTGVTLQAILGTITTRKDGSLKMSFESQELNAKDGAALLDMRNKIGWLLFSADELGADDAPKEKVTDNRKTQASRGRSALFVLWDKKGRIGNFDDFYNLRTNLFIEEIKSEIDEVANGMPNVW